jgi:hypothetical protein
MRRLFKSKAAMGMAMGGAITAVAATITAGTVGTITAGTVATTMAGDIITIGGDLPHGLEGLH